MNDLHAYARLSDPVTSWEAAGSVKESTVIRCQNAVIGFLMARENCTQQEAEDALAEREHLEKQRIRSAFTELERLGKIQRTSMKRKTHSGRNAVVWTSTQETRKGTH